MTHKNYLIFFSSTEATGFKNKPYHEVLHKIYADIFQALWTFELKFLMIDAALGVSL